MHGKVEGAHGLCAVSGCRQQGEYKAPIRAANFDGPGVYRLLCLDHVREHNAKYNYFAGMSPDEITEAQAPYAGWEPATRAFRHSGGDPPPAWSDFSDPLDAISARFRHMRSRAHSRFSRPEQRALSVLGLGEEADLYAVRERYTQLVRRYHPDRNGGDRSEERKLGEVIEAWQLLRKAAAFV